MQNQQIADILDEIAEMLEISEGNFFRVRAYRNAARTVRDCSTQLSEMSPEAIRELPGIGEDLAGKLETLVKTGELGLHRELSRKVSTGLVELLRLPGLGPKRVRALHEKLGVRDPATLRAALESGAVAKLEGFGAKLQQRLLQHLAVLEAKPAKRLRYVDAEPIVEQLFTHMRSSRAVSRLEMVGSFRRKKETVGDLDVIAVSSRSSAVTDRLLSFPAVAEVLARGESKTSVVLNNHLQVDLRVFAPKSYGAAMVYFTGSQAHCVHLRRIAQHQGLLLNEYGLYRGGKAVAGKDEEQIYAALGMGWIAPELREDRGEIEAAQAGKLPKLIERDDLRGDLHSHTTWTDGRATLEEMAGAARDRGLEYLAVTDHSRRLAMAHGLDPHRLREQWREIEQVEARVGKIKLLRGIEVDILEDGSLDLPDETLAELDWVVASVHYKLDQGAKLMTKRLIRAIRNPHVDVIGHPSTRLINHREPSNFDFGEILRAAREEGCALEINSQPDRLDLNDTACLAAKQAKVRLVVSSDAHHPRDFAVLEYGVNQARRGWVEPADVLNTRPLKQFLSLRR
jgi:DNA polymerase (family 10)